MDNLTQEQIEKIAGVLLDSKLQENLMFDLDNKDSWMLDYVFDSHKRMKFEFFLEKQRLKENLQKNKLNELQIL